MTGSEWNKIFSGLFSGAGDAATGYIIGNKKSDAQETYELAMKNVKDAAMKLSTQSNMNINGEEDVKAPEQMQKLFGGLDPNAGLDANIMNMQPISGENIQSPVISPRVNNAPLSGEDMISAYYKGVGELTNLGEYGKPYLDPFSEFMKSITPKGPVTKTDVTNGYVIKYDSDGNILKKTKIDDLPKQEKNTVMKYSKMTIEEAEQLTDNELSGDAFFYLPKETQTALMQKYPALQQLHDAKFKEGDFSPKVPGIKKSRFGSLKIPISDRGGDDNKKFDALAEYNNKINAGTELSPEEDEKYNTLRLDLGKRYNMDDTQLAKVIDRLESATSENDRKKIINQLEKGDYFEDVGTSQEQMEYDANRILEWQAVLDKALTANDGSYDGYKQAFLKELQDFYFRGSITSKEYATLKQMYF